MSKIHNLDLSFWAHSYFFITTENLALLSKMVKLYKYIASEIKQVISLLNIIVAKVEI